jgi:hypothetical protein
MSDEGSSSEVPGKFTCKSSAVHKRLLTCSCVLEPYTWNQTLKDVTLTIPVPENLRAKDFDIKIAKTHLTVKKKGAAESIIDVSLRPCWPSTLLVEMTNEVCYLLLQGELEKAVAPGDSFWTKGN